MICKGCGGVIGIDCFNPIECLSISRNIEQKEHEYNNREEVSWDEAFDEYEKDGITHTIFTSWLKDNFTLIRK